MPKSRLLLIVLLLYSTNIFSSGYTDSTFNFNNYKSENFNLGIVKDSLRNVNVPGLIAVGSVTPIALTGVYIYMNHAWWDGKKTDFHFDDGKDLTYARNLDKLGHFTSSCLVSNAFADILRVTKVSENWALYGGAVLSTLNATVIEIKDAYAPYWGFSVYDEMANILGAFYPVLQAKVPFMKNFNFKWSFDFDYSYDTEYYNYKVITEHEEAYSFIDDYDRQYFWLTVDWANIFCKNKPKYMFPYCIDFAIGMSANNLKTLDPNKEIKNELYIGFDVNLTKFFQNKKFGYYICKYLNFYHLPMPGMQVAPKAKVSYPLFMY